MSDVIPVYGSTVEWGDDGVAFASVPECKQVAIPEITRDYNDVTNLDSPNGFREFSQGLKDAGELSMECNYTIALYEAALAKQNGDALTYFRITLPADASQSAGDVFEYAGFVTVGVPTEAVGGELMININVKVSGAVTHTRGAAA